MAKLLIGCYSYNSGAKYGTKYVDVVSDVRTRMQELENQRKAKASDLETANAFQAIFVAPEYLFTKENTTKKREPLSLSQKDDIIRDLKSIGESFPQILMFPGTIFWEEPLTSDFAMNKFKANAIAAELNTKKISPSARDTSDTVTDGWRTGSGVKIPSLVELTEKADRNTFRAYNTLYGFLGKDQAMKPYSKQWDFKETEGAAATALVFVPGSSSGTDEIHKFNFGFEICFDHQNGALSAKGKPVDFHIIVSDSVTTNPGKASLDTGGCLIHASSNCKQTSVYRRTALGVQSAGTPYTGAPQSGQMSYWLVDVARRPDAQPVVTPVLTAATSGPTTPSGKKLPVGAFKLPGL